MLNISIFHLKKKEFIDSILNYLYSMQNEVFGSIYGFSAGIENGLAYIQESSTSEKIFPKPGDLFYTEYGGMSAAIGIVPVAAYLQTKNRLLHTEEICIFNVGIDDDHWEISSLEVLSRLEVLLKKVAEVSGCGFKR